jgi:hypothetical protein
LACVPLPEPGAPNKTILILQSPQKWLISISRVEP